MALRTLVNVARQPKCSPSARVAAAGILLDRGWGKAEQTHSGDSNGEIKITIRQIIAKIDELPLEVEAIEDVPQIEDGKVHQLKR